MQWQSRAEERRDATASRAASREAAGSEWTTLKSASPCGNRSPSIDVSLVLCCRRHRQIVFRLVKCEDAIERLALLDAIADLLEDLDARSLVDRGARRSREPIQSQAIDAGNHAIARCRHVDGQQAEIGAADRGPCASMIFCICLRAAPLSSNSRARA